MQTLLAILQVAATALAAWTTGAWLFRKLWPLERAELRVAVFTAVGLLIWSHLIFALAWLHLLSRMTLGLLLTCFCILSLAGALPALIRRVRSRAAASPVARSLSLVFASLGALYAIWLVACASLPPLAVDELVYHLDVPRKFLEAGGQVLLRDNVYAYFPQFGDMLFLFALPFGGETAAHLFHSLFALLLGLALYGFARQWLSGYLAATASAALLSVPTVMVIGAWAYVDLMFALFAFLGLVGLERFIAAGEKKWLGLTIVMVGGACSVKYTGIQLLLLLLLILLIEQLRGQVKWKLASLALFSALLIPSVYYLRNLALTGWPLFPFQTMSLRLSPEINWDQDRSALFLSFLNTFGAPLQGGARRALGPVLVFILGRFRDFQAYDGVAGPLLLLTPFLWLYSLGVVRRRKALSPATGASEAGQTNPAIRMLTWFAVLFLAYWTITTQQVRFLLPGLCALAVLLAFGLARIQWKPIHFLVWGMVTFNVGLAVREVTRLQPLDYWLGRESREAFISRHSNVYRMYQSMNRMVPPGQVYLVNSSNHLYYLTCRSRSDYVIEDYSLRQALERSTTPEETLAFFESKQATHIMLNEFVLTHPVAGLTTEELRRLDAFLDKYTRPAHSDRALWLYRIVEAQERPAPRLLAK